MRRSVGRERGGWWLVGVMLGTLVIGMPLLVRVTRGITAARGVQGWEWRLEGIRNLREAARTMTIDPGAGVSICLESAPGAGPEGGRVWFRWGGGRGTVLLVADFSEDFSDNVRLHDPEILVDPGNGDLDAASSRWGEGRDERLRQRDRRVLAWRGLLQDAGGGPGLRAEAVRDPALIRWLAGSFRPERTTNDASFEHGAERGEGSAARYADFSRDRFLEDGDADEVEVVPSRDAVRAGSGREHSSRRALSRVDR